MMIEIRAIESQQATGNALAALKCLLIICLLCLSIEKTSAQAPRKLIKQAYERYDQGQYQEAIALLKAAQRKGSQKAYLYYLLGASHAMLQEHDMAIIHFKTALERKKRYPEVYFEMGLSYFSLNRNQEAIAAFDQAIVQDAKYAAAYFNRGTVKCALDDDIGAKKDWAKANALGLEVMIETCD